MCQKKGLQNLFNVQRPWTNVEKVKKLYLQTSLPYHVKYTIYSSLNKHTPNVLLLQREIPMDYIKITISFLVRTLYSTSSMQWKVDF
jgi:uncharacterized protein YueI